MANATSPARPAALPAPAAPDADWPAQAADTIERVVGSVRDKTTGPALTVARGVVYGLFAGLVGATAAVLAVIALVRLIDNYLPDSVFGEEHMWATYLVLGVAFLVPGVVLWTRRHTPGEDGGARGR
jgi:hypothetical protein